ncbi:MAG: hypothetical protein HRT62_06305 [Epibacterium sp.]|nr:hypothetical protein [Epibacterium sp.]
MRGALKAINAAVVGVILNLSVWFGLHVLFANVDRQQWGLFSLWLPVFNSIECLALALFATNSFLTFRLQWSILKILLLSSLLGSGAQLLL